MTKNPCCFFIFMMIVCFYLPARAQNDSTWLDLGTIKLKRNFTKTISIKGEDLEKIPFANLSEVINAWLYGTYSNNNLIYVVDGNLCANINSYSIYDIEEIVFVQSALIQIGNVSDNQQLALVTTRRGRSRKSVFNFAGYTALVKRNYSQDIDHYQGQSESNMYHRYHLSGYYKREKIQIGASVNYLRDVFPTVKSDTVHTIVPDHTGRYQFSGFAHVDLGHHQQLDAGVSIMPESMRYERDDQTTWGIGHLRQSAKQFSMYPYLVLHSELLPRLRNGLSVSYGRVNGSGQSGSVSYDTASLTQLVIRDRLYYSWQLRQWNIAPSLDAMYIYSTQHYVTIRQGYRQGNTYVDYRNENLAKGHYFLVIPQASISFGNVFSLGGGAHLSLLPSTTIPLSKRLLPFAYFSADLLKMSNPDRKTSLKIFGSFARGYNGAADYSPFYRFTPFTRRTPMSNNIEPGSLGDRSMSISSPVPSRPLFPPHRILAAGARFSLSDERLYFGYSIEERNYGRMANDPILAISTAPTTEFGNFRLLTHHIDMGARIVSGKAFKWRSEAGITMEKSWIDIHTPWPNSDSDHIFKITPRHIPWTGGWTNHLTYKSLSLGFTILYLIDRDEYRSVNSNAVQLITINSFLLQNMYLSYATRIGKERDLDLYISSRNLWENSPSNISDRRQYFGAGFKLKL